MQFAAIHTSSSSSSSSSSGMMGRTVGVRGASLFLLFLPLVLRLAPVSSSTASVTTRSVQRLAFVTASRRRSPLPVDLLPEVRVLQGLRGGGTDDGHDDSDDDNNESDPVSDDDDDEEETETNAADLDAKLSASAVSSAIKTKVKQEVAKKQAAKRAVNAELLQSSSTSTKATKKKASAGFFRVPYVVRAFLNPVTVFRMTVAYWASLFDLDYLKRREGPSESQELRSALQEKAKFEPSKKKGGGGGRKQMKRGQSKSLSDLPQLSS